MVMQYTDPAPEPKPSGYGIVDSAETFAESDVSLSHSGTSVVTEGVEINDSPTATITPADDATDSSTSGYERGVIFTASRDVSGVSAAISANTGDVDMAYLRLHSDGSLLSSTDISALSAGDRFSLIPGTPLTSGTEYRLTLVNTSSIYDAGVYSSPSYPISGGVLEITAGTGGGGSKSGERDCVNDLEPIFKSGTAQIEWHYPDDVAGWDIASYIEQEDGETVDVFIEEEQSGGWTEIAGPINPGADIGEAGASRANNVRLRVELSRADTANNPRLEAAYRYRTVIP